ncbi:endonuclease [Phycisphaeraceae bacterium D3-23]
MPPRTTPARRRLSPLWIVALVAFVLLVVVGLVVGVAVAVMLWTMQPAPAGPTGQLDTQAGQSVDAAADTSAYYDAIDPGADAQTLRAQLHERVAGHTTLHYRELWEALAYTDADPQRDGAVVLFYTGWSRPAEAHGGRPEQWNREHVWAKSRGQFGTAPPAGTDLHHVRPTDVSVNQARANLAFDVGGDLYIDADGATECRYDHDSWEPRDAVKGDVARMLFYMAVRYESSVMDMELADAALPQDDRRPLHGVLATLLDWHDADPPDDFERRRNDRVYELQGNRNPFIDHPEWVQAIWGG